MKVLVAGAQGMLGHDLIPALKRAGHDAIACDVRATDGVVALDITDLAAVRRVIKDVRPDAVMNCAAYTNVDGAETDEATAYRINAGGSWNLALACQALDIPLLYISTDYVFDGCRGTAYDEYDAPNPQGVYGKSKRAGEMHVQQLCRRHYIVRTAWLYGSGGKNFVETILKAGAERPELRVVNDQWGTPTPTTELSEYLVRLIESDRYGVYHVSGTGACTWFDFAREILSQSGIKTPVLTQSTQESARPAPRPAYSVLDKRALRLAGFPDPRPWQESLREYMRARSHQPI